MKLHSIVLAAALAGTFGSAAADTITIDLVQSDSGWTSSKVGARHTAGAFTDTFTFTNYTGAAGSVRGTLVNTATNLSDITFTSATLNGVALPTIDLFALSAVSLQDVKVTGPLTLVISGLVTTTAGGTASYGGDFNVTSAVPEPVTYGMLLGGMAVLAFAARRRA